MTYIVAITGGIASGKTTVADLFAALGVPIIDTDLIARQVVELGTPALAQIAEHFGPAILLADGTLNRALLRSIIFNQPAQKTWLNQLVHPLIEQETSKQLARTKAPYAILVSPLLIETGQYKRVNRILVVDVAPQTQINRTITRDKIDLPLAQKMLDAQISREKRLTYADDIIENNGKLDQLSQVVQELHQRYLLFSSKAPSL